MDPFTIALLGGTAISGLGSLFGSSQANKQQQAALAAAQAQLKTSHDAALSARTGYLDKSSAEYQPIIAAGDSARTMYGNATGTNGADAQRAYYQNFQNDPGFQAEVDAGLRTIDRGAAARSGLAGGSHLAALEQYGQRQQRDAFDRRMSQMNTLMQPGNQARMGMAGSYDSAGRDVAGIESGYGDSLASSTMKGGQLKAESTMAPWNALSSTMSGALKAYGGRMGGSTAAAADPTARSGSWAATTTPSSWWG